MTPYERKLWYLFLRKYPVKIYKQRIIGRFIVDFYCASAKLVIEVDGSQHYELKAWHMTQNVPHFCRLWVWRSYDFPTGILTGIFVVYAKKLTLPFKIGCKTLSVTCGDSSPKWRAKASCN